MSSAPQTQSYSCPACGKKRSLDAKGAGSAVECSDCHAWHLMPLCDEPTKLELPAPPRLEPARVLEQELATASLLDQKLPKTLLGQHFMLGCYTRNPFRLLGVSATSDADDCERVARRMRNRAKAGIASTGAQIAVHLGYDGATVESDSAEIVTAMKNSRIRLVWEVLWFHTDDVVKPGGDLADPALADTVRKQLAGARDEEKSLLRHTLAIITHNHAMACELNRLQKGAGDPGRAWLEALNLWAEVCADAGFWKYMEQRVSLLDDARLGPAELALIREELPGFLVGFNIALAAAYAEANRLADAAGHLRVIHTSKFPAATRRAAAQMAAGLIAGPKIRQATTVVKSAGSKQNRIPFREFHDRTHPALEAVERVFEMLRKDMGLEAAALACPELDTFCEDVRLAVNSQVAYDGDDAMQAIQQSVLCMRRVLGLPASEAGRKSLEQDVKDDARRIYNDMGPEAAKTDPGECFFIEGEPAAAGSSYIKPMHKITRLTPLRVEWNKRTVLVPRSRLAAAIHEGNADTVLDVAKRSKHPKVAGILAQMVGVAETEKELAAQRTEHAAVMGELTQKAQQEFRSKHAADEKALREQTTREKDLQKKLQTIQNAVQQRYVKKKEQAQAAVVEKEKVLKAATDAFVEAWGAWHGVARIEIPIAALSGGLLLFAHMVFGFEESQTSGFQPSDLLGPTIVVVGALIGLAIGRALRTLLVRAAQARQRLQMESVQKDVTRVDRACEAELARETETVTREVKSVQAEHAQTMKRLQASADEYKKEAEKIQRKADTAREAILKKQKKAAADVMKQFKGLAKPSSHDANLPALRHLKSEDFESGLKPDTSTVSARQKAMLDRFVAGLMPSERLALGRAQTMLDADAFARLIEKAVEDRSILRSLDSLVLMGLMGRR